MLMVYFKLSLKYNNENNIGLYRDDDLTVFKNINGQKSEKVKEDFQKLFKGNELDIVIRWPTLYMAYYMLYSRSFMNIN